MVLAGLQVAGKSSAVALVSVATLGNVLGAVVNWILGRYLIHFQDRRWFPIKEKMINKATVFYQKWGVWTLLLAWMPFIGDPFLVIASTLAGIKYGLDQRLERVSNEDLANEKDTANVILATDNNSSLIYKSEKDEPFYFPIPKDKEEAMEHFRKSEIAEKYLGKELFDLLTEKQLEKSQSFSK